MSKAKSRRRRKVARKRAKRGTIKVRRVTPPPCRKFGGSKAEQNKRACRGDQSVNN